MAASPPLKYKGAIARENHSFAELVYVYILFCDDGTRKASPASTAIFGLSQSRQIAPRKDRCGTAKFHPLPERLKRLGLVCKALRIW